MSDRTPKPATVRAAWCRAHPFWATTDIEEREAEFDRMIAEVERAAAERALTDAIDRVNAKAKAFADSAIGLRAEKEWADSNRYSNYAAGLDMAANEIHKAAEAYRREGKEQ